MLRKLLDAIEKSRIQRRTPEAIGPAVHTIDAIGLLLGRGDRWMVSRMKASADGRALLSLIHI